MRIDHVFRTPPRAYTLVPFWFLNDALDDDELRRQLDDFAAHGVHGVIPHPRLGLPDSVPFLSDAWMHALEVCVEHAAARRMTVILYDEGMYPSGSAAGAVVAENADFATRCVAPVPAGQPAGDDEETLWEDGAHRYVNCPSGGVIRGVHYGRDDTDPGAPPSGDLLNPEAMAAFFRLVHERHYEVLGQHFGETVTAFFTDEPNVLGRRSRRPALPWTWGFDDFLHDTLGYDMRPHLATLFDESHPGHERLRRDYGRAVTRRLEQTFYAPYARWCADHGIGLTGHPHAPDDLAVLRHFHIPGQDIVWRQVEPRGDSALEGPPSTMATCALSAQVHHGRRRNANECFGAYGHEFTEQEMRFITNWLLVRGTNLLFPHAFFYSMRGPRRDERPPDVGPNSPWWDTYGDYAAFCNRLCALTGEGAPVCDTLILGRGDALPWRAARVLQENQRGYLYADTATVLEKGRATPEGLVIGANTYGLVIADGPRFTDPEALALVEPLAESGRAVAYMDPAGALPCIEAPEALMACADRAAPPAVRVTPACPALRCFQSRHPEGTAFLFANEGPDPVEAKVEIALTGSACWWDPWRGTRRDDLQPGALALQPLELLVLWVAA
jgi:hypothetical protein